MATSWRFSTLMARWGLVSVRQVPLAGEPVELAGTAWELVPGIRTGGDRFGCGDLLISWPVECEEQDI